MDWRKTNFCFYCLAFIFYGGMITAMGPVIPFFAAETGQLETYYSFIFFWRALGYVVGGFAVKYLVQKFSLHGILTCAALIGGLSFMASTFSLTFLNLSVTIFVGASCCIIINVICNICIMKIFPSEGEQGFYIQLLHTIFGVGGLLGPFVVSFLGSKSYFALGLILAIVSLTFLFLSSPDGG
jgi:MFS family permease